MTEEQTPRHRGAQPGNVNALKHGFYSRRFNRGELNDLDQVVPYSLTDEINMMRVVIRRVVSLAEEGRPPDELLTILDTLGIASQRLANLLKTKKSLENNGDASNEMQKCLDEVIHDLLLEKKLDLYASPAR
jgi:hypothetical protein